MDDELVELDLTTTHVVADGGEMLMDALDDDLFDLDRGVLFLLEQKQPLEDTIKVDFEKLVTIIDGLFQLRRDFKSLRKLRDIRIDKDGVGISVNDL